MRYHNAPLGYLGRHSENDIFYFSSKSDDLTSLPHDNWICLAIANENFDKSFLEEFIHYTVNSGLIEFKSQGKYGELIHDFFDETIVEYEIDNERETNIMTTWYSGGQHDLSNALWSCFYANILPENIEQGQVKIVCTSFDGLDYRKQLAILIAKLNTGWIPPD
jgi:hypothetical protein